MVEVWDLTLVLLLLVVQVLGINVGIKSQMERQRVVRDYVSREIEWLARIFLPRGWYLLGRTGVSALFWRCLIDHSKLHHC